MEMQYLLLVNKQLCEKEDAGPGQKIEGSYPGVTAAFCLYWWYLM